MAKTFTLEGEIGWAVGTWDVKNILDQAGGEDIIVNFASPGGSVFTGLKIFNLFKAYEGNVDFHLTGEAASMGSYIPLAGRKITAEPNVVYMIHNARTFTGGDHNELRKVAKIIEGLSKLVGKEYVKRTGKAESEITTMMDEETYLFGHEAVDAGFIDEIVGEADSDPDAQSIHTALAKEAFEACMSKLKSEKTDDYEQVAALIGFNGAAGSPPEPVKAPAKSGETKKEKVTMDLNELKSKHPGVYAEAVQDGRAEERDRVSAFLVAGEASGDMKTAITAITDGSKMTATLQTTFLMAAAGRKNIDERTGDDKDAGAALENADIETDTDAKDIEASQALLKQAAETCGVEMEVK